MNKFTYGDAVQLKPQHAGEKPVYACIVGITPIETDAQAEHFKAPVGTVFYLIEFGDGSDALVQEEQLEAM